MNNYQYLYYNAFEEFLKQNKEKYTKFAGLFALIKKNFLYFITTLKNDSTGSNPHSIIQTTDKRGIFEEQSGVACGQHALINAFSVFGESRDISPVFSYGKAMYFRKLQKDIIPDGLLPKDLDYYLTIEEVVLHAMVFGYLLVPITITKRDERSVDDFFLSFIKDVLERAESFVALDSQNRGHFFSFSTIKNLKKRGMFKKTEVVEDFHWVMIDSLKKNPNYIKKNEIIQFLRKEILQNQTLVILLPILRPGDTSKDLPQKFTLFLSYYTHKDLAYHPEDIIVFLSRCPWSSEFTTEKRFYTNLKLPIPLPIEVLENNEDLVKIDPRIYKLEYKGIRKIFFKLFGFELTLDRIKSSLEMYKSRNFDEKNASVTLALETYSDSLFDKTFLGVFFSDGHDTERTKRYLFLLQVNNFLQRLTVFCRRLEHDRESGMTESILFNIKNLALWMSTANIFSPLIPIEENQNRLKKDFVQFCDEVRNALHTWKYRQAAQYEIDQCDKMKEYIIGNASLNIEPIYQLLVVLKTFLNGEFYNKDEILDKWKPLLKYGWENKIGEEEFNRENLIDSFEGKLFEGGEEEGRVNCVMHNYSRLISHYFDVIHK